MNNWMTPFIVRRQRPNWKLADAITEKFGCQTVYGRYVKEGYGHFTYELFCVFARDQVPADAEKMATIDNIQRFAFAFIEGTQDGPPESVDDVT